MPKLGSHFQTMEKVWHFATLEPACHKYGDEGTPGPRDSGSGVRGWQKGSDGERFSANPETCKSESRGGNRRGSRKVSPGYEIPGLRPAVPTRPRSSDHRGRRSDPGAAERRNTSSESQGASSCEMNCEGTCRDAVSPRTPNPESRTPLGVSRLGWRNSGFLSVGRLP
jgi:hypothetical protein